MLQISSTISSSVADCMARLRYAYAQSKIQCFEIQAAAVGLQGGWLSIADAESDLQQVGVFLSATESSSS